MRPDDTRKAASLRSAGDQPRDAARRDQPPELGGIDQPETSDKAMPSWAWPPGSSEFPSSSSLAVARRTDLGALLASLPSSDLVVGGARRAHPGLPQGERRRAAGIIAARGPSISRGGGARHRSACAPALHWPGYSSRAAAAAVRVVSAAACSGWELHRAAELFPIRTRQFISFCGLLHRAGSQVTPPPPNRRARMGQVSSTQTAGRTVSSASSRACFGCARPLPPGGTCSGCQQAVGRVAAVAMRCGARSRALKLSLGPHAAVPILVLGRSEYWVATQTTESRR